MGEELGLFLIGLVGGGSLAAARHRLIRSAARCYVASAELVGEVVEPVREEWRRSVREACRHREEAAARAGKSVQRKQECEREGEELLMEAMEAAEKAALDALVL